jgi:hypothetical protein
MNLYTVVCSLLREDSRFETRMHNKSIFFSREDLTNFVKKRRNLLNSQIYLPKNWPLSCGLGLNGISTKHWNTKFSSCHLVNLIITAGTNTEAFLSHRQTDKTTKYREEEYCTCKEQNSRLKWILVKFIFLFWGFDELDNFISQGEFLSHGKFF